MLTRVDLHKAFKEKIGIDFRPYSVLGACNPPLAHRALSASAEVGLLLPCNVAVEASSADRSTVRIVNPLKMMKMWTVSENPEVQAVAQQAAERLRRVAEALAGEATTAGEAKGPLC